MTEELFCYDCNRAANTECKEQKHRMNTTSDYVPPSLIDAAKEVERWWLELDKRRHGFYGAPHCMFSLREAIEAYDAAQS